MDHRYIAKPKDFMHRGKFIKGFGVWDTLARKWVLKSDKHKHRDAQGLANAMNK